jgi:hypothetical protein
MLESALVLCKGSSKFEIITFHKSVYVAYDEYPD